MTAKEKNTEKLILEAAHRVFLKKGMSGARMQEIANEAGINKALLHYYFKNKDMLFTSVFRVALGQFIPRLQSVLAGDRKFDEKLLQISANYHEMLMENPYLPGFILQEVNREPEKLIALFKESGIDQDLVLVLLQKDIEEFIGKKIDPRHFLLSLLSLVIFPILAMPMMCGLFFENNRSEYELFLEQRKQLVPELLMGGIKAMAMKLEDLEK